MPTADSGETSKFAERRDGRTLHRDDHEHRQLSAILHGRRTRRRRQERGEIVRLGSCFRGLGLGARGMASRAKRLGAGADHELGQRESLAKKRNSTEWSVRLQQGFPITRIPQWVLASAYPADDCWARPSYLPLERFAGRND